MPNNVPLHIKMFLWRWKCSFASKNVPKVFCRQEHYWTNGNIIKQKRNKNVQCIGFRNVIQHIIGKSRKFVRWSAITVWKMFLKSCSHSPNNVPLSQKVFLKFCSVSVGRNIIWQMGTLSIRKGSKLINVEDLGTLFSTLYVEKWKKIVIGRKE